MIHPLVVMLLAWAFVIVWIGGVIFSQRKHHPKVLFFLFFTELWERFSYYGMRALLILYMVDLLKYKDAKAYGIFAAYVSLVYATPVLGGMIADKLLGSRSTILLGAILMMLGHFAMAFEHETIFFLALGLLVIGNGFFKPNISTLVGKLYLEGDPRRDSAFTLFYMGINAGAFLTPLTCGALSTMYSPHVGFAAAGIGMLIGLCVFLYAEYKGYFQDQGLPPNPEMINAKMYLGLSLKNLIYLGAFVSVPLFSLLVNFNQVSKVILWVVIGGMMIYLIYLSLTIKKSHDVLDIDDDEEVVWKERLWVVIVLFLFTTMFWTFFELAGSAITLFTERNVDRSVSWLKEPIPTPFFQSVNPFFIIILAPAFAWLWEKLGSKGKDPSTIFKFSTALIQLGLGFMILVFGAKAAGPDALAPLSFLVFAYLLHTTGELCLSPIGLSLVTKLSPPKIVAFVMGFWLLSSSLAGIIGGEIAKLTSLPEEGGEQVGGKLESLMTYSHVFEYIAYISIATGIFLMFLVPRLKSWMHGVK